MWGRGCTGLIGSIEVQLRPGRTGIGQAHALGLVGDRLVGSGDGPMVGPSP
jgi:hypothetical protein